MSKIKFLAAAGLALAASAAASPAAGDDAALLRLAGSRQQLLGTFEDMPQQRLETIFLRCDRASSEGLLDLADAIPCAMASDALLKRRFGGDFNALLAWWRVNRDSAALNGPAGATE